MAKFCCLRVPLAFMSMLAVIGPARAQMSRVEATLHSFSSAGAFPGPYPGLVRDSGGSLYGVTTVGGTSGYGMVFKLDPAGNETMLHGFTGGSDGAYPYGGGC